MVCEGLSFEGEGRKSSEEFVMNFIEEVKEAVEYDESLNRTTKEENEFDQYLLGENVWDEEEETNSHFSYNNRNI